MPNNFEVRMAVLIPRAPEKLPRPPGVRAYFWRWRLPRHSKRAGPTSGDFPVFANCLLRLGPLFPMASAAAMPRRPLTPAEKDSLQKHLALLTQLLDCYRDCFELTDSDPVLSDLRGEVDALAGMLA